MAKTKAGVAEDETAPATKNKVFEEWRVEPKYQVVTNEMGDKIGNKLAGFDKVKLMRTTSITQAVADEINSQSENTGLHLFETNS